jgi:serine/threonine-protein kinase
LPVPPSRRRDRMPRDLETICLKCLQKAPGRRYASARALADDLRNFLEGRPIQARPVGRLERFGKWVRCRPALAAVSWRELRAVRRFLRAFGTARA